MASSSNEESTLTKATLTDTAFMRALPFASAMFGDNTWRDLKEGELPVPIPPEIDFQSDNTQRLVGKVGELIHNVITGILPLDIMCSQFAVFDYEGAMNGAAGNSAKVASWVLALQVIDIIAPLADWPELVSAAERVVEGGEVTEALSGTALARPLAEQAMFRNFSAPVVKRKGDHILSNFRLAAFALGWFFKKETMDENFKRGQFSLPKVEEILQYFSLNGFEEDTEKFRKEIQKGYTKCSLDRPILYAFMISRLTLFLPCDLTKAGCHSTQLVQYFHYRGNADHPKGLAQLESKIDHELIDVALGTKTVELALNIIFKDAKSILANNDTDALVPGWFGSPDFAEFCPPTAAANGPSGSYSSTSTTLQHPSGTQVISQMDNQIGPDMSSKTPDSNQPQMDTTLEEFFQDAATSAAHAATSAAPFSLEDWLREPDLSSPGSQSGSAGPSDEWGLFPHYPNSPKGLTPIGSHIGRIDFSPRLWQSPPSAFPPLGDDLAADTFGMTGFGPWNTETSALINLDGYDFPGMSSPIDPEDLGGCSLDDFTFHTPTVEFQPSWHSLVSGLDPADPVGPPETEMPFLQTEADSILQVVLPDLNTNLGVENQEQAAQPHDQQQAVDDQTQGPRRSKRHVPDGPALDINAAVAPVPRSRKRRKIVIVPVQPEAPTTGHEEIQIIEVIDLTGSDDRLEKNLSSTESGHRDQPGFKIWLFGYEMDVGNQQTIRSFATLCKHPITGAKEYLMHHVYRIMETVHISWLGKDLESPRVPKYLLPGDTSSMFYATGVANWQLKTPEEQQKMVATSQVFVGGLMRPGLLEFTKDSFERMGVSLDRKLEVQDHGLRFPDNPNNCIKITDVDDFFIQAQRSHGLVLAIDLPELDGISFLDPEGFEHLNTSETARLHTRSLGCAAIPTPHPVKLAFAATCDATTPILFNAVTTVRIQDSGTSMCYIGYNESFTTISCLEDWHPFHLKSTQDEWNSTHYEWEGIRMCSGDVLIIQPGQMVYVITCENSIGHHLHFHTLPTIVQSVLAMLHVCILGAKSLNSPATAPRLSEFMLGSHPDELVKFAQILVFWVKYLTTDASRGKNVLVHLPDVETATGLIQVLMLGNLVVLMSAIDPRTYLVNTSTKETSLRVSLRHLATKNFHKFKDWFHGKYTVLPIASGCNLGADIFTESLLQMAIALAFYKRKEASDDVETSSRFEEELESALEDYQSEMDLVDLTGLYKTAIAKPEAPLDGRFTPWNSPGDLEIRKIVT
ncbi:hypothetical protein C8R46DRAFT_1025877 [Mycena filopes]|nr:hypothetical protein C8R46DRAFT_1025877 [Mycena filopes]